ncbi:hypothetical protein [Gelidibacter japonicus]|uniref:hypothetical protein n=1 Tax=Gelidibacter japonicus TaxID=1962232 RepID=UPI0013D78523|nr:hypothetical protein [Gelidibacter japonicus]
MKTCNKILLILLFVIGHTNFAQTPEQQKMIDKATKMRDSIMESIGLQELIEEAEAQQKEKKIEHKKSAIPKTTKGNDKYWRNTLVSNHNTKLINWNNGAADLVFNYAYDSRNDKVKYVKVGAIKADGTVELNPTDDIPELKPLNNFKNSNPFYDIHNLDAFQYTSGDAGFKLNPYLLVYQNEQKIGVLTIGNSEKVTLNLLTLGDMYYGDEGYLLSWVYVDKDCALRADENWTGDLTNTGEPLLVETKVSYDLKFKAGWNLIKTEVIGTYLFPDAPEEDRSRYKKHEHTSIAEVPKGAIYYFRSAEQY